MAALSCPRCSAREKGAPLLALAFLTDPEMLGRILRHLGLPVCAPPTARGWSSGEAKGFDLFVKERGAGHEACEGDGETGNGGGREPGRGPSD